MTQNDSCRVELEQVSFTSHTRPVSGQRKFMEQKSRTGLNWMGHISFLATRVVDCVWNVMAHAQKPDFVFRRNGRVHLNQQRLQFSRLLAAEVYASAVVMVVMLDTPRFEVAWEYWLPTPFASSIFTSPRCVTVCHQVSNALYTLTLYTLYALTRSVW